MSKRKEKKKARPIPHDPASDPFIPEYRWSDRTIIEADGDYEMAWGLMKKYGAVEPWCIRSDLTLIHPHGIADMTIEFHSDRTVKIVAFRPSTPDPTANFDIRCMRAWTDANHWNNPQPSLGILKDMKEFWRFMWETYLIDCDQLDAWYGKRRPLDDAPTPPEPEEQTAELSLD